MIYVHSLDMIHIAIFQQVYSADFSKNSELVASAGEVPRTCGGSCRFINMLDEPYMNYIYTCKITYIYIGTTDMCIYVQTITKKVNM